MKALAGLLLMFAVVPCAQDRKVDHQTTKDRQTTKKRLESVTWDLKTHKLVWVVQNGSEDSGEFVAENSNKYEISPDDAVMEIDGEKRAFTGEEAASLHKLLDTLSLYCAESVLWWDQGQGVKLDQDGKPVDKPAEPKGQKVEEHRKPARPRISQTDLIASLSNLPGLR